MNRCKPIAILAALTALASPALGATTYYARIKVAPPTEVGTTVPPAPTWTTCGQENEYCRLPGQVGQTRPVRYGVEGHWKYATTTLSCGDNGGYTDIPCTNSFFTTDPAPNVYKHCEYGDIQANGPTITCR